LREGIGSKVEFVEVEIIINKSVSISHPIEPWLNQGLRIEAINIKPYESFGG